MPPVPFILDEFTKQFVWRHLLQCADRSQSLLFFIQSLPKPLSIKGEVDNLGKTGVMDVLYPYRPVSDRLDGLRGSCSTFGMRVEVTHDVVRQQPTLEDAKRM